QVTVGPSIHSEFTASTLSGCAPLEVDFTHMMTGPIALFLWNFGDYNFSVQPNPTHTFENFGTNDTTYTVSLSVISSNFFCVETYELDILVHPYIKAGVSIVPNQSCNPYPASLGNTSIGNDNSIWDFGDGQSSTLNTPTVDHLFENYTSTAVTYNVHLTVANEEGCQDTISYPITVFPHVEANFTPSGIEGCAPYEVNFTDASIGVHLYHWDFGDGAISYDANPAHTFNNQTNATIVYPVKLKVFNQEQCVDSLIIDITVKPEVKAGFVFNPANACNPYDVEIINTSTGASSYAWDFGDGTNGTNADPSFTHYYEHNNTTPLTYYVSLEVENPQGCISNLTRELIVYPKINADFSANEIRGCNPLEVQFNNLSTGANTYYWDFGDGGSATDVSPQHTFVNTSYLVPDTFSVVLKSVSQWLCESYDTLNIVVYPAISPEFNIDEPSGCSPHAVVFTQSAQGGLSYTWNYGDGDTYTGTDLSVNHTYVNSGSEPVSYTAIFEVTNSFTCSVQSQKEIIVYPEVHASFSHTTEGCHPLEASFTNNSQHAHSYLWEFGDGYSNMVDNPTHTYYNFSHTNSIEMFVSLYAESSYGCSDIEYSSIEVFPKPDASFIITNSPGCSPHEIIIVNMSEGALNYSWDFDDGATSTESQGIISHLYNHEPGTGPAIFDIGLIVDNSFGCYDTLTQQAIIYPNIVSEFQSDIIEGCHPLTVEFLNESTGATANTPYHWDYGDGLSGTSQDLTHTHIFNNFDPVQTAVFEVSLIAENENGCKDTSWVTINVFPRPQPSYNVLNSPGCSPHTVEFVNTTAGGQDFLWTFGDGATSDDASTNINHLYTVPAGPDAGIFNVSLWAQNQFLCDATFIQQVTIYPDISAQIDVVSEGCHPFAAEFTNLGAGGNIYLWDFGDGNQSVAAQPQNTYFNYDLTNPAQFTVVLEATSAFQCVAYDTVTITVNPKPEASFHMESTSGCAPFQTQITNLSTG
ncbi:MAG: PKD domain-containing protein, partial [Bacteroidales bacterium]|nr:PKD domain-containing protein [Bacteroidales bacterium]